MHSHCAHRRIWIDSLSVRFKVPFCDLFGGYIRATSIERANQTSLIQFSNANPASELISMGLRLPCCLAYAAP